ncbi:hypothetical protein MASR2M15_11670 [Anaerolineales bacterium]
MADSLFDNRYRYDYIYPRGRSGETLRAIDTEDKNRPVVIKRPAPNDAPPIRNGQEVSIRTEKRALQTLSGHPALTELLGSGQFRVGNTMHDYIVLERADGVVIEEEVLDRSATGDRLPELETLIIIDQLLDLLATAHLRELVYNDVDVKHLYWNREQYRLKVIDWGNAVFLEGDAITPQGVSRQSDIFQVGEVMYFIYTGGKRADIPRDAGAQFQVDFGQDANRMDARIREIISRALHPNLRIRYESIQALRNDLARYRDPIERQRNLIVMQIREQLKTGSLTKSELRQLAEQIDPVVTQDAGYPPAREAHHAIHDHLRDLNISADLDAVRIYMESGNWAKALDVLKELRDHTGSNTAGLVRLLQDICVLIMDSGIPASKAVMDAIALLFDGDIDTAAKRLLVNAPADEAVYQLQWQIAERISSRMPEILLLVPNLLRLSLALQKLNVEGITVNESRQLLSDIMYALDQIQQIEEINLRTLQEAYQEIVEKISILNPVLQTLSVQHQFSERRLPLGSLDRALNAAMAMADNMHIISKQATTREAPGALDSSKSIEPANPLWAQIKQMLENLYRILETCQIYTPAADGSDIEQWLNQTYDAILPFTDQLFDDQLLGMVDGIRVAEKAWQKYRQAILAGNRSQSLNALGQASVAVKRLSPTLSNWFRQLGIVVKNASFIQRHSIPGAIGRTLADGWEAYMRGNLNDAERLGAYAIEISRSEAEKEAAQRLYQISQIAREWVERGGISDMIRSEQLLARLEESMTEDEQETIEDFGAQMPSTDVYLKTMQRGLVDELTQQSTAAIGGLFIYYILRGSLEAQEKHLVDANFWLEAAKRSLGEYGSKHVATRQLQQYISRRDDLNQAAEILNGVNHKTVLPQLEYIRGQLSQNAEAKSINDGIQSLRELEAGLQVWSDGDFRAAGTRLEEAIKLINSVEANASITLTNYRAWLMDAMRHAAELHIRFREMKQVIAEESDTPQELVREVHEEMVNTTTDVLGTDYAATFRNWRDSYESFLGVYTDQTIRRSKRLEKFNNLFQAMFIDRHPAYPLYQHWYHTTEHAPEFPAPPTDEPVPQIRAEESLSETDYRGKRYLDHQDQDPDQKPPKRPFKSWLLLSFVGVLLIGALLSLLFVMVNNSNQVNIALTITAPATQIALVGDEGTASARANAETITAEALLPPDSTPPSSTDSINALGAGLTEESLVTTTIVPTARIKASATATDPPPTHTASPTATQPSATPSATYTPSVTFTPSFTPSPTLPPEGLRGGQDLLALFNELKDPPWNPSVFINGTDHIWRLGTGDAGAGDFIRISPSVAMLEQAYGNNAAQRIYRVETEVALRTFNPGVLKIDEVSFGLLLEHTADGNNAGIKVDALQETIININKIINNEQEFLSQKAVSAIIVRLRIDRDIPTGRLSLYVNDSLIGQPINFVGEGSDVLPILFINDGGVIMGVTKWTLYLR